MPDPITETPAVQQQNGAPPAGEVKPTTPAESEQQPNSKGWEAANKFKADAEATAKKLADAQKELDAYRSEKAAQEKAAAEKNGEWEKLYKDSEAKREAAEKRAADTEAEKVRLAKRSAVSTELLKLGLLDTDDINLIDLDSIQDDGKNAADVAKKFAESKPHKFGTGKSGTPPFPTPQANPGGAPAFDPLKVKASDVRSGKLTREQLLAVANSVNPEADSMGRVR